MKKLIPILIILSMIFNINLPAMAGENITINQTANAFLVSDKANDNLIVNMFSPDDHNLDLLIGAILSVVPGFGVGHFWLGNQEDGWLFFKLDLIMLAAPLALAVFSTIFSSLGLIKTDSMNNTNVFSILGLVAWASALGIKIWEMASVWRFIEEKKKKEISDRKVSFSNDRFAVTLYSF